MCRQNEHAILYGLNTRIARMFIFGTNNSEFVWSGVGAPAVRVGSCCCAPVSRHSLRRTGMYGGSDATWYIMAQPSSRRCYTGSRLFSSSRVLNSQRCRLPVRADTHILSSQRCCLPIRTEYALSSTAVRYCPPQYGLTFLMRSHKTRSTRDRSRSIPRTLQKRVSTKSSISRRTFFSVFNICLIYEDHTIFDVHGVTLEFWTWSRNL